MLRFPELRSRPADTAVGTFEINGIKGFTAQVALVAPCPRGGAEGADSLNIPIGKPPLALWAIGLEHPCLVDIVFLEKSQEKVLRDLNVVIRGG